MCVKQKKSLDIVKVRKRRWEEIELINADKSVIKGKKEKPSESFSLSGSPQEDHQKKIRPEGKNGQIWKVSCKQKKLT